MISRLTNKTRAWNKISNKRLNQILNQTKLKTMLKFCLCSSQGKSSPCPSGSPFVPSTSSSHVIPSTSSSSEASSTSSEGVGCGHRQRRVFCLRCGLDPRTPRTFLRWALTTLSHRLHQPAQTCNWGVVENMQPLFKTFVTSALNICFPRRIQSIKSRATSGH